MAQVILEDRNGNFWITCNRGFYRVPRSELDDFAAGKRKRVTSIGYGPGDGLRSTSFAGGHQPAGAIDSAGRPWLPSFSGLVVVDPARLPGSGKPPSARIDQVTVNGVDRPLGVEVVLPPGSAPLSIRYMATTLRNADRVRFRYRMEGAPGDWVDAGRSREAFFPTLGHGTYRFVVAASIDGRTWGEAAAPLSITVKPYFFQTSWFLALIVLAVLVSVATILRVRTGNLRRQKAEMERQVAEKTEELRLANEHLAQLSFIDSLTGVANRRRFDETLEQEWNRGKRFETPLALLIADVDYFKPYNDTFGHPEGDKCLVALAEVLANEARRAGDFVARYGGEEFVILVPGADLDAAVDFAERLRKACEARAIPHPASLVSAVVTVSIGLASRIPSDATSSESLLQEADSALYQAKRSGRNRVGYITPIRVAGSA
jgi:diguanylate cyclase (GGDEF)-like protein